MLGFTAGVSYSAEETRQRLWAAWESAESQFRGATSRMAETWTGLTSMMSDQWFGLRNDIMDAGAMEIIKEALKEVIDLVAEWRGENAELIGQNVAEFLLDVADAGVELGVALKALPPLWDALSVAMNWGVTMALKTAGAYQTVESAVLKVERFIVRKMPGTDKEEVEKQIAQINAWIKDNEANKATYDAAIGLAEKHQEELKGRLNRSLNAAASARGMGDEAHGFIDQYRANLEAGVATRANKAELEAAARSLGYEAPTGPGRDRTETVDRKATTAARAAAKKAAKEEERLAAERLKLHQDLTEKIKDLTLNEYEFKRWTLDQEWEDIQAADAYRKASAEERTAIETEFARYKVLALAEISKAEKEAAAERVKAAQEAAEKIRRAEEKAVPGVKGLAGRGQAGLDGLRG